MSKFGRVVIAFPDQQFPRGLDSSLLPDITEYTQRESLTRSSFSMVSSAWIPRFSDKNETTYRPTNEDCLMRVVTSPDFCKACIEGLWLSLLRHVDLIDGVSQGCLWRLASDANRRGHWKRTLDVELVPLAQFRMSAISAVESYAITWTKDGKILEAFTNKTTIEVDDEVGPGTYTVNVKYSTDEVRSDTEGSLTSGGEFNVTRRCTE